MNNVENSGGEIDIMSTENITGEQLVNLGSIIGILRYKLWLNKMTAEIVYIDEKSEIPLCGVDFIGIIDRGTNIIELKPLTLCNLKCKYCFVSAGNYNTDFIVNPNYLLKKIKDIIKIKGNYKIEIHFAPYGEILLYSGLFNLIKELWNIEGVEVISLQTNGLLLNKEIVKKL